MVKRQTVWLSTMMVLSLMLIGYYTMNSGSEQTSGSDTSVKTSVQTPMDESSTPDQGTQTNTNTNQSQQTSDDFFVIQQTNVNAQLTKTEDRLMQVLSNNNFSSEKMTQAEQQLRELQNLQGGLQNAQEAIRQDGFADCAIVPNQDDTKVIVYVKTKSLSALDAAKVMNIVNQQMNFPIENIEVKSAN